jgi:hypothetical protein
MGWMTEGSDFESLHSELTVIVNTAYFLILQQPVDLRSGGVTVTFSCEVGTESLRITYLRIYILQRLHWRGRAATAIYRLVLSSERAPNGNNPATVER